MIHTPSVEFFQTEGRKLYLTARIVCTQASRLWGQGREYVFDDLERSCEVFMTALAWPSWWSRPEVRRDVFDAMLFGLEEVYDLCWVDGDEGDAQAGNLALVIGDALEALKARTEALRAHEGNL